MFDRLQKPFLTVETGEAYQPLRLTYELFNKDGLIKLLDTTDCISKNPSVNTWNLYWKGECEDLHFESLDSFRRNVEHPVRLGSISLKDSALFVHLPSFKRACILVPFLNSLITNDLARVRHVDFINKVFSIDERLPHGFTELFKEDELERILEQRNADYQQIQEKCEDAPTAEEAFNILKEYTESEAKKRFPYAERYVFDFDPAIDTDIIFLSFYIFLRGRELVAIKRWLGESNYSVVDMIDETVDQVFGGMDIDILD